MLHQKIDKQIVHTQCKEIEKEKIIRLYAYYL